MTYIYKNAVGINLPRASTEQSTFGTTVSRSNLQEGDLIFSSTNGTGKVSHVGIYVGNGEMIHSPKPGDVVKKTSINKKIGIILFFILVFGALLIASIYSSYNPEENSIFTFATRLQFIRIVAFYVFLSPIVIGV